MAPMPRPPWGPDPEVDWDEENTAHVLRHRVMPWEVDELIREGEYEARPHKKRWKDARFRDRYLLNGRTLGGRPLEVVADWIERRKIRPVTAYEDR